MAETTMGGMPVRTAGDLPEPGTAAPAFTLTGRDLGPVALGDLAGRRVVLNIFPSVDTRTCATSVREFNARASEHEGTTVVCVSADLPFAQTRFCGAEGLEQVVMASTFRSPGFGDDYGVRLLDGPFEGLLARAVVVVDGDGTVLHRELVEDIGKEPDYEAALAA